MFRRSTLTRAVRRLLLAATLVVSLAPLRAQDYAAKAITLVGDVSYLRDGPTGYKWALNEGQTVKPGWLIRTGADGYVKFQVSDGSTFEVFPNTEATFRQDPGNWTHLLNVWIGHIKVMIQHLPGVPNPNNVTSPTAVISVRGTIFEVVVEDLAGTTFVSLEEGQVLVQHRIMPGNSKMLLPGQSIRILPNEPLAKAGINKGGIMMRAAKIAEQGVYEILRQRTIGGGGPAGGTSAPGAQGDKGGSRGSSGSGGSSGAPAPPGNAPPAPPAAPPPTPPGGPGGNGGGG